MRHFHARHNRYKRFVSIHAPVKDATYRLVLIVFVKNVSIHAPVKDATLVLPEYQLLFPCFNPRTRKGCDRKKKRPLSDVFRFNPRTRKGCDVLLLIFITQELSFNPRTRKGCDQLNL